MEFLGRWLMFREYFLKLFSRFADFIFWKSLESEIIVFVKDQIRVQDNYKELLSHYNNLFRQNKTAQSICFLPKRGKKLHGKSKLWPSKRLGNWN